MCKAALIHVVNVFLDRVLEEQAHTYPYSRKEERNKARYRRAMETQEWPGAAVDNFANSPDSYKQSEEINTILQFWETDYNYHRVYRPTINRTIAIKWR